MSLAELRPLARAVTRWFAGKYGLDLRDTARPTSAVSAALEALRAALGGRQHLLSRFSYADMVMATLIQGIAPVADRYIPLGPATREAWTQHELARRNADLVAWRDRLYAQHRPERASSEARDARSPDAASSQEGARPR